jgi:hypothetical protein
VATTTQDWTTDLASIHQVVEETCVLATGEEEVRLLDANR